MGVIRYEDLEGIRRRHKHQKIVFCSGCFDLTHAGHVVFFEECKKLGDILVVMVARDSNVRNNKGDGRPILNERLRLKMIDSLKPVDYCLLDLPFEKGDPLSSLSKIFQFLQPDIYVVNADAFDLPFREKLTQPFNVTMKVLCRDGRSEYSEFDSISTSEIITKIKGLTQ